MTNHNVWVANTRNNSLWQYLKKSTNSPKHKTTIKSTTKNVDVYDNTCICSITFFDCFSQEMSYRLELVTDLYTHRFSDLILTQTHSWRPGADISWILLAGWWVLIYEQRDLEANLREFPWKIFVRTGLGLWPISVRSVFCVSGFTKIWFSPFVSVRISSSLVFFEHLGSESTFSGCIFLDGFTKLLLGLLACTGYC